jgi:mRNA interferase RelE/StbE
VLARLATLAEQSRPDGIAKLKGEDNVYWVRVSSHRIVYEIFDTQLIILIVRVAHRR